MESRPTYLDIVTLDPGKRSGKPTIRGMRITVYDVLSYLAAGMSTPGDPGGLSLPHRARHSCLSQLCS